jgi:hypothetical protein
MMFAEDYMKLSDEDRAALVGIDDLNNMSDEEKELWEKVKEEKF